MEELKKDGENSTTQETPKETYTKQEVDELINKKITDTFGELLKELNKKQETTQETPKEKTIKDFYF